MSGCPWCGTQTGADEAICPECGRQKGRTTVPRKKHLPVPPAQRGELIVTNPEKAPFWQRLLLRLTKMARWLWENYP